MSKEKKILNPFEQFVARRIAEFPTLYTCKEDVISTCILGSQGECYWENGILRQPNHHYDKKTKKLTQYPLRIPLKEAAQFHQYKAPHFSYDIGNSRAPISNLPNNADKSYLEAVSVFLFVWGRLTEEDWKIISTAKCLISYQCRENKYAGEPSRTHDDYLKFMKLIPEWTARIRAVEHFQQHGKADAAIYQGLDI